jgi:threonine dehydrogenase-like Zn-dependent dehydrogenase
MLLKIFSHVNLIRRNSLHIVLKLDQIVEAYDTFGHAATEKALKVILTN